MSDYLDEVLEHYGVKGMKWGVRKDPDRVSSRKQAKMEKKTAKKLAKADKKWAKKMTPERIDRAMKEAASRTKKEQGKLATRFTKTEMFKKADAGDEQAMRDVAFAWTIEYANILNKDMRKQVDLISPSGKKAVEVMLAEVGDRPFMAPRIVDKE